MKQTHDFELDGVGFIAVEPRDAKIFRRGGVIIWARRTPGGFRLLSVQDSPMISVDAGHRPAGADTLLVSPPMIDGRRRREVRKAMEQAAQAPVHLLAAE